MAAPENIRSEVWSAAGSDFAGGRFDDAIYEAFKLVETKIQERIGSSAIGRALVEDAFLNSKIVLSSNPIDQNSLSSMFTGAIGYFRGDRAHGAEPSLPIKQEAKCLRILGIASALLDLLDADEAVAPHIVADNSTNVVANLLVRNVGAEALCLVDGEATDVIARSLDTLAVNVAGIEPGEHTFQLVDGERVGRAYSLYVPPAPPAEPGGANWYRVVYPSLTAYATRDGDQELGCKAVVLESYEAGKASLRCFPTAKKYNVGDYVSWDWDSERSFVSEAGWVQLPDKPTRDSAWGGAAFFAGKVLGNDRAAKRLVRVRLSTEPVAVVSPETQFPLVTEAIYDNGIASWSEVVDPGETSVVSSDTRIVHVDKAGIVRAKDFGHAEITVTYGGKHAKSAINITSAKAGDSYPLVAGFAPLGGVSRIADGVAFTNRSDRVFGVDGSSRVVTLSTVQLPTFDAIGLDNLATDAASNIYVRAHGERLQVIRLAAPKYRRRVDIILPDARTPIGMCGLDDGVLITAENELWMCNGSTLPQILVRIDLPVHLAILTHVTKDPKNFYVLDNYGGLHTIDRETLKVDSRRLGTENLSAIHANESGIFVTRFHDGELLKLVDGGLELVASGLGLPHAICDAPDGGLIVSDFEGGRVLHVTVD
jgi:uncharacterized protein (TIGR02391 family)